MKKKEKTKSKLGLWMSDHARLGPFLVLWAVITLVIIGANTMFSQNAADALDYQKHMTERTLRCISLAEQMQEGSDTLTNTVRSFVATRQPFYAESYLNEMCVDRSRDHAIEALREESLSEEVLHLMEDAKLDSDQLMVQELHAIRLVYGTLKSAALPDIIAEVELSPQEQAMSDMEKMEAAEAIVFEQAYATAKAVIDDKITLFMETLRTQMTEELNNAMAATDTAMTSQHFSDVALVIWSVLFLALIYWLVIRPMHSCCTELDRSPGGEQMLEPRGTWELRSLIGAFNNAIGRIQDKNKEITDILMVDPVTGGYTLTRLEIRLSELIHSGRPFAFICLDIRRFKVINDAYGSESGNLVLQGVNRVISMHLKEGEAVARVQSDLFDIIMLDTAEDVIESRIRQIRHQLNDYQGADRAYYLSLSCGVYVVSPEDKDIFTIRDRANAARKVHKAQADFQNVCVFFSNMERQRLLKEQAMENTMNKALENNEFTVYFQPKVCPADEHIVGAEALVRWDSPSLGWLSPGAFIPLFERNGFIIRLDYYVFRQVCCCLRQWMDSGKAVVPVSVNLSAKHLSEPDFIDKFKAIQKEYGIPDAYLEFELTEALVFEDMELLKSTIDRLHGAGYECSMDDFGSGYSSLNVLKEMPLDILKLDRVFFTGEDGERGSNVVRAVVAMARELGMRVVAEGVEDRRTAAFLRELECDMIQGYVYYKPMPAGEFEKLM